MPAPPVDADSVAPKPLACAPSRRDKPCGIQLDSNKRLTLFTTILRGICFLPLGEGKCAQLRRGRIRSKRTSVTICAGLLLLAGCGEPDPPSAPALASSPPSILLVTLDTARADAFGFEGGPARTPTLDALAAESTILRGYATAPMTLPSHTSMMTGLYPAEHGVHENARRLPDSVPVLAETLQTAGYSTAAFLSAVPLDASFGLDRGFDVYQDDIPDRSERSAVETTGLVTEYLRTHGTDRPTFLWVHYFDPHAPYEGSNAGVGLADYGALGEDVARRYLAEIEAVDRAFAELLDAGRAALGDDLHVLVVGDHGESLGEHGERTHGNLLFEGVLRVPMVAFEPGRPPSRPDHAVSVRRVFGTVLQWAGATAPPERAASVFDPPRGPVLAEAMQPFLQYGWQPHAAAVAGSQKALLFGSPESGATLIGYDLEADPREANPTDAIGPALRAALRAYPLPVQGGDATTVDPSMRNRLAELGYLTGSGSGATLRAGAPRAIDQTHIFDALDRASMAFERGDYDTAIGPLREVVAADPNNVAALLRLAVVHSVAGRPEAERWFDRARELTPESTDLQHYEGMHLLSRGDLDAARTLFEAVLMREPNRPATLRALSRVTARQGDTDAALDALDRLGVRGSSAADLRLQGRLLMDRGRTEDAIRAFEDARTLEPDTFDADLELGVLLLAARRFEEARDALQRELERSSREARSRRPMALFKRAQVAVLLDEADADDRIRAAVQAADAQTAPLVANERLFEGRLPR